jgi:hypothetical protein
MELTSQQTASISSYSVRSERLAMEPAPPLAYAALFGVAGAMALLHILTNGRYGFHRDELQF